MRSSALPAHPISISAVFPAYNDGGTIASMVLAAITALRKVTTDFEVVVVNDGSEDYTPDILAELAEVTPSLRVIHHDRNMGYGATLRTGFSAAQKDWIFYTDGDAQYNPLELARLTDALRDGVDIINGYKTSRQDAFYRRLAGFLYNQLARWIFGIRIRDVDCDFRLFRRSILRVVALESDSGTIGLELVRKMQDRGFVFLEVPVSHYGRPYGVSQFFQFRRLVKSLQMVVLLWWKLVVHKGSQRNSKT